MVRLSIQKIQEQFLTIFILFCNGRNRGIINAITNIMKEKNLPYLGLDAILNKQ